MTNSHPRESCLEKARSRLERGRARFLFKIYFETGDTWRGLKAERRLRIKQLRGGGSGDGSRSKCASLIELLVPTAFTSFVARPQRITTDSSSVYRRARGDSKADVRAYTSEVAMRIFQRISRATARDNVVSPWSGIIALQPAPRPLPFSVLIPFHST